MANVPILPDEMEDFERELRSAPDQMKVWPRYVAWVAAQPKGFRERYLPALVDRCVDCAASRHPPDGPGLLAACYLVAAGSRDPSLVFRCLYQRGVGRGSAEFFVRWAEAEGDPASALKVCRRGLRDGAEPADVLKKRSRRIAESLQVSLDKENVSNEAEQVSEPCPQPYIKMVYSDKHTTSVEERMVPIYCYKKLHGVSNAVARKVVEQMPRRIYSLYLKMDVLRGHPEASFDDLPKGLKLIVPEDVAGKDGPRLSMEEWLSKRPKYAPREPSMMQVVHRDEDESVLGGPSVFEPSSVSRLITTRNVDDFSLIEAGPPPPPESDSTFFGSSSIRPPPGLVSFDSGSVASSRTNRTQKFPEETTIFTRAARKEMSDLWFHGSTVETHPDESATTPSASLGSGAPPPGPNPLGFEFFEDATTRTHVRRKGKPEPEQKLRFAVDEDEERASVGVETEPPAPKVVSFPVFEDKASVHEMDRLSPDGIPGKDVEPQSLEKIGEPVQPVKFDFFVDPSCLEPNDEPEPENRDGNVVADKRPDEDETWNPDEDFTLGFLHDRTKFQQIAKKKHLQSTPMERNVGPRPEDLEGDTMRVFKKPDVPPKKTPGPVSKTRARASLVPAMSPLVETSREYCHSSSSSTGGKSRYGKSCYSSSSSSSCTTSDFDGGDLLASAMHRVTKLGVIKETGHSGLLNVSADVTEVETAATVRAKLLRSPFNQYLKLRLAAMSGNDPSALPNFLRNPSTSWEDFVVGGRIKLSNGEIYAIQAVWDLVAESASDSNTLFTVAKESETNELSCFFVKLMEPVCRWEIYCWTELARRTGRPPPRGTILANDSLALVELLPCRDLLCNSLSSVVERYSSLGPGQRMPEPFVLAVLWNLVSLVEEFHACDMVVGPGLVAENLIVSGVPTVDLDGGIGGGSVLLADLSAVVDMTLFPRGTRFPSTSVAAPDLDATRAGEDLGCLADWAYDLDYVSVVRVLCRLLFPGQRFAVWREHGRLAAFYGLKRGYAFRQLWVEVADLLLNPSDGADPLAAVRARIAAGSEVGARVTRDQLAAFESALRPVRV